MASRGGYQPPSRPAPVSGPGKLARRTDSQPVRNYPAEDHGDRKMLREQQQGAPMAAATSSTPNSNPTPGPQVVDPFGPSRRPNEPPTAGIPFGPGPSGQTEVQATLDWARALYASHPSEALRDAIEELETLV